MLTKLLKDALAIRLEIQSRPSLCLSLSLF